MWECTNAKYNHVNVVVDYVKNTLCLRKKNVAPIVYVIT